MIKLKNALQTSPGPVVSDVMSGLLYKIKNIDFGVYLTVAEGIEEIVRPGMEIYMKVQEDIFRLMESGCVESPQICIHFILFLCYKIYVKPHGIVPSQK